MPGTIAVGLTVQREVCFRGPREPEHGHRGVTQIQHRIPKCLVEFVRAQRVSPPIRRLVHVAAAVDRDGKAETVVDAGSRRRDDPAPRNTGQADLGGVDGRQRTHERVGQNGRGRGMIHPLVADRGHRRVAVNPRAGRTGHRVLEPVAHRQAGILLGLRGHRIGLPLDGDAHRRIAPVHPFLHPLDVSSSATPMHKNDTRHRAGGGRSGRQADVGVNARGRAAVVDTGKITRGDLPRDRGGGGGRLTVDVKRRRLRQFPQTRQRGRQPGRGNRHQQDHERDEGSDEVNDATVEGHGWGSFFAAAKPDHVLPRLARPEVTRHQRQRNSMPQSEKSPHQTRPPTPRMQGRISPPTELVIAPSWHILRS